MSGAAPVAAAERSSHASRAAAGVQAKLSVGRTNDGFEQEADRVADAVVARNSSPLAGTRSSVRPAASRSAPTISRLRVSDAQRAAEEDEPQARLQRQEEEEPQARLQRQEEELQTAPEPRANVRDKRMYPEIGRVEGKLFEAKGGGEPLPDDTRIAMETSFGADFSGVRMHTGADAVQMSRHLKAQAFTHGKDVFFNSGKYEPDTVRGRSLLAHELTHVVQQGAAKQALPDERVEANNADRDKPPPEPADRDARQVEEQTRERIEEGRPEPVEEAATGEGPHAAMVATPEATVPGTEEGAVRGGEAAEGPGAGEPVEGGKEPGEAAKESGPAVVAGAKEGGPPGAGEGGGVGTLLRRATRAVFEAKKRGIGRLAEARKKKEPAAARLEQAEKAVVPPAEEARSRTRATQVEAVEQAPEPRPDEERAKRQFEARLEAAVPATLEEVDKFKEEGKGRVVGEAVKEVVTADTKEVKGTYQEIDNPPEPAPPETTPEELPAVEPPEAVAAIDPGEGIVGEVPAEQTDLSEFEKESDAQLEKEEIEEEHLEMVDEGDLGEANRERKKLKTRVQEAPAEVEQLEKRQKETVGEELRKEEEQARRSMSEERRKGLGGAREDQKKTKSKIELERQKVTDHVNGIYQRANETVKKKLEELEQRSLKEFEAGEREATRAFEDNVNRRIDAFKQRRYDRFGGSLLWAKDKLFGMDDLPEVKGIFDGEKSRFVSAIDALIARITAENKRVVAECKEIVAAAKAEIETYVAGLGPRLRETGRTALKDMKGKLAALDKQIEDKESQLKKKLAARREAAIKAIEEKIEAMKEEMSGLVSKLGNLLLGAMLKFFKWALKKAGVSPDQLMAVIDKGKAVIKRIVTDPIAFIGNLVKAAKTGIEQFVTNIRKHLIGGLISWLTGAMADVPITLPDKWDLKGILHLVLQILGLTWDRIRVKLVKRLGERVVKVAETSVEIVRTLITEGPMGLWEMIKEKAAEIKQQVMEGIRNWVITNVVKQAVIKLVSFLNPAGAILQAILAIYNVIMFFVENIQRIITFVKSVFDSVGDIAMGKISAAASAVERAMAMTIPIILNFLARLIGLSGIGKAVSNIIEKIRKPIDKVVDKVIDMVAKAAKKLFQKGKSAGKRAAGAAKGVVAKLAAFVFPRHSFKAGEESHELYFEGKLPKASLMVASRPTTLTNLLNDLKDKPENADKGSTVKNAQGKLRELTGLQDELADIRKDLEKATRKHPYPKGTSKPAPIKSEEKRESAKKGEIKKKITQIGFLLSKLMVDETFGAETDPIRLEWPKPASKDYPKLAFGPKSKNRIDQKWLIAKDRPKIEAALSAEELADWRQENEPIETYTPEAPKPLPMRGPTIGIQAPYNVFEGKKLKMPRRPPGSTPGGGKIHSALKQYGYSFGEEGTDGDHVVEIQMGGKDDIRNLWPLDSGPNRAAGGTLARQILPIGGKKVPMSVLKTRARASKSPEVWFRIARTMERPLQR